MLYHFSDWNNHSISDPSGSDLLNVVIFNKTLPIKIIWILMRVIIYVTKSFHLEKYSRKHVSKRHHDIEGNTFFIFSEIKLVLVHKEEPTDDRKVLFCYARN